MQASVVAVVSLPAILLTQVSEIGRAPTEEGKTNTKSDECAAI